MISLLSRLFIKDHKNYDIPAVRRSYGMLGSIVGIVLNIILFGGKYFAGIISGSIAITADAFNNLSDAGSSLITLIGFKLSGKKSDSDHPFGHGRIEYLAGLGVSVLIIFMGLELVKSSFTKILHPIDVDTGAVSIIILLCSILVKMYMAVYNSSIGRKIASTAMKATAMDSLTDCIATGVVLLSMLFLKLTGINIDGYSGILVAIFILCAGFSSAKDTISPLLGQAPDHEFVKKIEDIVLSHKEIIGIHDLVVHDYGPGRVMISLHGEVPGNGNIFELHDVIDCIENELHDKLNCEAVIHMDPVVVNDSSITEMHHNITKLVKTIDECITIHDFRMIKGPTHTNLIFDAVVPHDFKMNDEEIKQKIEDLIHSTYENCYAVVKIDKLYAQ